ncbi:Na(+)/H(+) exchanger beta-like [Montipora foliosa]|uniref:Na(+)/H(+) exchanger beta-like n=1 Tax=Montipora foliosa TaxID=591990 RepID=UPI0035F183CD
MSLKGHAALFLIVGVLIDRIASAFGNVRELNVTAGHSYEDIPSLAVAKFDFQRVAGPLVILVWILIASLAKLGFHLSHKLSSKVPESCLVIVLGIIIGGILKGIGSDIPSFSSDAFFLFMLPPIVLEAGYFLQDRAFFENIGTILLYAIVGTIFNTFTVGLSLYAASDDIGIVLPIMHALTFASLISAVDPVAVLAVFEEIHVNVMLYILVFGESLLNDAVTVVLYHLFESLTLFDTITYAEVLKGLASFLVVSVGGTILGFLWGLATAFVTKYTDHVRVIEPIFVFVMSYLAYLTAEMFHLSGIMSIVTCAIVMKPYVELNISRKSHTTIKYFLKMMSSGSETLIFMFLGVRVVTEDHKWNTGFVLITLVFILVFRAIGVVLLTFVANLGRINKLSAVDQFIMSYGGIRGAVSFSLAVLLSSEHFPLREMFVTTTIAIVLFTVFFQGMTIKPLVRILKVKLRGKEELSMYRELNDKLLGHLVAGIEQISGHFGYGYYKAMVERIHSNYLRRWLIRDANKFVHDDDILLAYRRLAYKDALTRLEREGSGAALLHNPTGPVSLQRLCRSAFEASVITAVEPANETDDETKPIIREGDHVRVPDAIQKDWRAEGVPSDGDLEIHEHSPKQSLDSLLARHHTSFRHRKMFRNNVIEDDEEFFRDKRYLFPMKPRETAYQNQILVNSKPVHLDHKRKPKHRRRGKKHHKRHSEPPKKKLSAIFEEADLGDQNGKTSPTFDQPVGTIPSSEDDEPGITFTAPSRGPLGRYPSFEDDEGHYRPNELVASEPYSSETSSDDDDEQPNKKTGTTPKDSLPMGSVVVNIEDETIKGEKEKDTAL